MAISRDNALEERKIETGTLGAGLKSEDRPSKSGQCVGGCELEFQPVGIFRGQFLARSAARKDRLHGIAEQGGDRPRQDVLPVEERDADTSGEKHKHGHGGRALHGRVDIHRHELTVVPRTTLPIGLQPVTGGLDCT